MATRIVLFVVVALNACAHGQTRPAPPARRAVEPAVAQGEASPPLGPTAEEDAPELTPEQQAYAARYASDCERLDAAPVGIVQRVVKTPDDVPVSDRDLTSPEDAGKPELSPAEIRSAINAQLPAANVCVEDALDNGWPDIYGYLSVRFAIVGTGQIDGVTIVNDETGIRPLQCCVASAFARFQFRATHRKSVVVVTFPLTLSGVAD